MGQKVNPRSLRLGYTGTWDSLWFASKDTYRKYLHEDIKIRKYLNERLKNAGISSIKIERSMKKVTVDIYAAKPGIIIGRGGEMIEVLKEDLRKKFGINFEVNIKEVYKSDADPKIVAFNIARQIEGRFPYRRAVKMAIQKAKDAGCLGIKICVCGRLNGVDIARSEFFKDGNIPLHTFRADIHYAYERSNTKYGVIGIKVWVYNGMVMKSKKQSRMLVKTSA